LSVQVSYKKQFTLGFLFLIVTLLVIESLARSYEWVYPNCDFIQSDAMKDVDLFTKRQICLDWQQISKDTQLYFPNQHTETVNINSFGFRGDEISFEKPDDTLRIFMVGGSTVFGTGSTSDKTTISYYLQSILNDRMLSKKIEVINAGESGGTSSSEKSLIFNYILDFEPDIIIGYSGWNDSWHRKEILSNINNQNFEFVSNIEEKRKKDLESTGIIHFIQHEVKVWKTPLVIYKTFFWDKTWRYENVDVMMPKDNQTAELWKENWNEICQKTPRDIPVILALQPILGTGNKELSPHEEELKPKSYFDKETVIILNSLGDVLVSLENSCNKTIDLRNVFDEYSNSIYLDKGHVNDLGNKIIAKQLDKEISSIIGEMLI
jgi:hypothetical protein